jgi:hypothetical protein
MRATFISVVVDVVKTAPALGFGLLAVVGAVIPGVPLECSDTCGKECCCTPFFLNTSC